MTESVKDRREVLRGIASSLAFIAVVIAAIVFTGFGTRLVATGGGVLGWIFAIPLWVWAIAWLAYLYWITRKLYDISQQQKEILQLLKERRTGEGK